MGATGVRMRIVAWSLAWPAAALCQGTFRALPEATPTSGPAPLMVKFYPGAQSSDGVVVRYRWNFEGRGFNTQDPGPLTQVWTYRTKGDYNATLELTNDKNQVVTASVPIHVTARQPVIWMHASPSNGAAPLRTTLAAVPVVQENRVLRYEWDLDGRGFVPGDTSSSRSVTFNAPGVYPVKVRSVDSDGLTAEAATEVRVGPAGTPSVTIGSPFGPIDGSAPFTVRFGASVVTDSRNPITKVEWDLDGDGVYEISAPAGPNNNFTQTAQYSRAGSFLVSFRATNSTGLTSVDRVPVTVNTSVSLRATGDTCRPGAVAATIETQLKSPSPVSLLIRDAAGGTVRTLVSNQARDTGTYRDSWDCMADDASQVVDGAYYAILRYASGGDTDTLDLTRSTGGQGFAQPWSPRNGTNSLFEVRPYENKFLIADFTVARAAEITADIRLFNSLRQVVPLVERRLYGQGSYTLTWDGADARGRLVAAPQNESLMFSIAGVTLPDNAIVVQTAPELANFRVDPNFFDPATGNFLSPDNPAVAVSFDLSTDANVAMDVISVSSGRVVRSYSRQAAAGRLAVGWDGRNANGIFVDSGDYRLAVRATGASGSQAVVRYVPVKVFY